ncbi:Malate synthase G, partial [hydrothermal vent metagenome]
MTKYVARGTLQVATAFADFVENEMLPGLDIGADHLWQGLEAIVRDFTPRNMVLLDIRKDLQTSLDIWQAEHAGNWADNQNRVAYKKFLKEIGYLVPEGEAFQITVNGSDPEVSSLAGPQLVVPVDNARYAINAANARWGSLFDAFYGTDVIPHKGDEKAGYDAARGALVIARANDFLDTHFPLKNMSHDQVISYDLTETDGSTSLTMQLQNGQVTELKNKILFVGHQQSGDALGLLFCHHGLHMEILIDRNHPVGAGNPSGVC